MGAGGGRGAGAARCYGCGEMSSSVRVGGCGGFAGLDGTGRLGVRGVGWVLGGGRGQRVRVRLRWGRPWVPFSGGYRDLLYRFAGGPMNCWLRLGLVEVIVVEGVALVLIK